MRKRPARFLASELIRSREGNCNASRSDSSDAGVCMANVVERSLAAVNDAIHWLLEVGSVRFCVERYIFYELVNPNARWKCARGNGGVQAMQGVDRTRRAYPPWQISARRFLEQDI